MTYLQPALLALLLLTALGLLRRCKRVAWLGLGLVFLWAWPPFAWLFAGSLEWFYPSGAIPPPDAQVIVVLSSSSTPSNPSIPEPYVGWDTYQRCKHAAWLYHHWRAVPVIASGGPAESNLIASRLMRSALEAEGVPSPAITTEEQSLSTYENGAFTAAILRSRGIHKIVLVTEAQHMLRSDSVFRKQGLEVVPAPCAAYTAGMSFDFRNLLPAGSPVSVNNNVLHEWLGLAWYKLRGWI
jgi:uncharacterized SAM-binding protein YcdF (DUF218 family)